MGWKHGSELDNLLLPSSKECVGEMYELERANLSFNKKSYVYALLQKLRFKEHASERVILKNMLHKGYILNQRVTHKII